MVVCFLFLFFLKFSFAQTNSIASDDFNFKVNLLYGTDKLVKNKKYSSSLQSEFSITTVKFYISNIKITYKDGSCFFDKNGYYLISLENEKNEFKLSEKVKSDIDSISFMIGVDEEKAISGEMEGDLDPMNGMFWSWQSGFSSFKLEGNSPSCKSRKNEFIFHIGGYKEPYNSLRTIEFYLPNSKKHEININVDFQKLMNKIDLSKVNNLMSPSIMAMKIADYYKDIFSL